MATSDILALAALLVSLVTFYWATLRQGRITSSTPRIIAFIRGHDGHAALGTTLLLTNTGPRPIEVNFLSARLRYHTKSHYFHCIAETPFRKILRDDEVLDQPSITQETAPQPFSLPAQSGLLKHLVLQRTILKRFRKVISRSNS